MQWSEEAGVIDTPVLERVLAEALRNGGDFAEVFAEDRSNSSAMLDDGRVEELSSGRERGAGIRVVTGETTGFAHTADLSERGPAPGGRGGLGGGPRRGWVPIGRRSVTCRHRASPACPATGRHRPTGSKADALELLQRADEAARASGDAVSQVQAGFGTSRRRVLIANSDGLLAGDEQSRTRFSVSCVALADTGMQTGYETAARTLGFELFDEVSVEELARTAAAQALAKLSARPAPSGELPVVLAGGAAASSSMRRAVTASRPTTS